MRASSSISSKGALRIKYLKDWRGACRAVGILNEAEVLESGLDLCLIKKEGKVSSSPLEGSDLFTRLSLGPKVSSSNLPCSAISSKTAA